jgi:hypothetical protein
VEKERWHKLSTKSFISIIEDPTEQSFLTLLFVNIIKLKAGLSNRNGKKEESTNGGWKIFDGVGDEADKETAFSHTGITDQ